MPLPASLSGNLKLPLIAAPMFLVSGPELVIAACKSGIIGTFPALNQRSTEGYGEWLDEIEGSLGSDDATFGINLIVHRTNPRVEADMRVTVDHKVPLVITSLGAVKEVVEAVHSYGGVVFHDVINLRHAAKATEAGVDGLILVCNGAGGHAGTLNPFAFISEVRQMFEGTIILAGCLSSGSDIAAASAMGADLAYMGTRFINTSESRGSQDYKDMISASRANDIIYTSAISGIPASFMRPSIEAAGLDPNNLPDKKDINLNKELDTEAKAWKNIWSAGQGVGGIHDAPPTPELVARLIMEYEAVRA